MHTTHHLPTCVRLATAVVAGAASLIGPTGALASTPSEPPTDTVDGLFDVGGHRLYLNCRGTGSPTVLYLHGSIPEPGIDPHSNGLPVQGLLSDDHRTCVYDRRNLAHSDTVDAVQTPDDVLADLHNLLAAADIAPPYVLLGASFGGLVAYLYANTYPDDVVGMVLLDSMFPDEMTLEHLFPPEDQYEAFDAEDEQESLERISHFDVQTAAAAFIGREPAIPVTYIAALQEPWDEQGWGIPEYDEQILALQATYVSRFSPGSLIWLDVPHFMEVVAADEIAAEVRHVIALADA